VRHVFGADLLGRHNKNLRILQFESEIRVELSHLIIEIFDLRTTLIPARHTNSVKEWNLGTTSSAKSGADFVAIGYHRKKFQQTVSWRRSSNVSPHATRG
jgi:hypothetical protein